MKKIISLFKRDYEGTRLVYDEVVEGAEWVINGEGIATEKFDGTACMISHHNLFKRYDRKKGKAAPEGWIPCEPEPDPKTGHWPGWLPVGDGPEDKWHRKGFADANDLTMAETANMLPDGTYELVGPKVQGNPYKLDGHTLWRHGCVVLHNVPRNFEGIKAWFESPLAPKVEGIVWHHPDGRMVKIKRRDFGLRWPPNSRMVVSQMADRG